MEKIDEFIDYSAQNKKERELSAEAFKSFTAKGDFEKLADIVLKASFDMECKSNKIPNLGGLYKASSNCKKLKSHVNNLLKISSIEKMCEHYNDKDQQIVQLGLKDE